MFVCNRLSKLYFRSNMARACLMRASCMLRSKYSTICSTDLPEFQLSDKIRDYSELHRFSVDEREDFWGTIAKSRLKWHTPFTEVADCNMSGEFAWFRGGRLNIAENCVDRHAASDPDRTALIWEKDEPGDTEYVSYRELLERTSRLANVLKSVGVTKGDRVAIYMPNSPVAVCAMLACMRLGAMHSVVFAGFSATALAMRINDASCKAVITTDQAIRGGKYIDLKATVDEAVSLCPSVKHVLMAKRTGNPVPYHSRDIDLDKAMEEADPVCPAEPMESEDRSFMLYTSGSTGKPKGLVHSTAGYILYASFTHQMAFNYQKGDVYACVADIGWITGHSYVVYGPLANGSTTVLFESIPTYPNPGRYWEMVERLKINQFYTAPTALRLLLKSGDDWVKRYDTSSLQTLGCVGEPLNHEAWKWYNDVIGRGKCDVVDTWWQTETGGMCITPRPSAPGAEIRSGLPMRSFLGIQPALLNPNTKEEITGEGQGHLCIKHPWPGCARTIYNDHERFLDTYFRPFPGYYFSGDGASRTSDGYYQITGRTDDVINTSGHRLGTAEIEDVMDEHPSVAETAVVGYPHPIKGESVYAYVILKDAVSDTEEAICANLRKMVKTNIASYAVPDYIQITPGLPKTRSGKIMRRILRKVAASQWDDLGDVSTLADPSVVKVIVDSHKKMAANNEGEAKK